MAELCNFQINQGTFRKYQWIVSNRIGDVFYENKGVNLDIRFANPILNVGNRAACQNKQRD